MRTKAEVLADLKQVNKDIEEANDRDWEEYAQDIVDKLFNEFPVGSAWLQDAIELVKKYGHVMSPIGRVRRLWRIYTGKRGVISAAGRRAQNSPIQGFASEIGCTAAFLILKHSYEFIKEFKLDMKSNFPLYNRAVHDANYFTTPFAFVIPHIHITQYVATNGVTDWYREIFGLKFTIEPEIELEIGASESKVACYKWLWEIPDLLTHIYHSLLNLVEYKRLSPEEVDPTFELILKPWKDKKMRKVLMERYPLLNIPDLNTQIEKALAEFVKTPLKKSS